MAGQGRCHGSVIGRSNCDGGRARHVHLNAPRVGGMSAQQVLERTQDQDAGAKAGVSPARRWVFITWYPYCRRSDALGQQLGAPSYLVHYLRFKTPILAPFKYVLQTLKTAWILLRARPDGVLVANPPAVAPLCTWLASRLPP